MSVSVNRYQVLFEQYVSELRSARSAALVWWQALFTSEVERRGSLDAAEQSLRTRWPFGPTSHPYVVATYRKYFLACVDLNDRVAAETDSEDLPEDEPSEADWGTNDEEETPEDDDDWGEEEVVDPPTLLLEMLEGRDDELAQFMAFFVFPCIGEEGGRPA